MFFLLTLVLAADPGTDRFGDPLPKGATARLGTIRGRTTAKTMALSADGKTLLTLAGGRTLGRWDVLTGRCQSESHLPGPYVSERCWFSQDGSLLAVPGDKFVELWQTQTGKRRHRLAVPVHHAAFSDDGRWFVTTEYVKTEGVVRLWNLETGESRYLTKFKSYANGILFSHDGKRLYAAIDNHSLRCWEVATAEQVWRNEHWAQHLALSPDGRILASDTYLHRHVRLWDALTGKRIASLGKEERGGSSQLAFSPDGRYLAEGEWTDGVRLWDVKTHKLHRQFKSAGSRFVYARDGKTLFSIEETLQRWDIATGKPLYPDTTAHGHVGRVTAVAFAPDGRSLSSTGEDSTLREWDLATK